MEETPSFNRSDFILFGSSNEETLALEIIGGAEGLCPYHHSGSHCGCRIAPGSACGHFAQQFREFSPAISGTINDQSLPRVNLATVPLTSLVKIGLECSGETPGLAIMLGSDIEK